MANRIATIITIGDELLIGQTIDTNSAWIAQKLNELGIDIFRRVAVADNAADIRRALDEEIPRADIILLTGGLGPTSDDITKPLLCDYFGGKLVVNEKVLEHVMEIFRVRNRPLLQVNLKQAEVPDVCKALFNRMGTAPGMLFLQDGKAIISMPGVPFEMMAIMEDEVLPYLQLHFTGDAIVHRTIITAGEGESFIADRIQDFEHALPHHIHLAYLPSPGMVKLRLTARGPAKDLLIKEVELLQNELAARLENIVVSLHDFSFEHILGEALLEKNICVGFAESCTGGYIAHKMTEVIGASRYLKGSIVCYSKHIKTDVLGVSLQTIEDAGIVSEEVAAEMAKGALKELKCDCALGITGLLGPGAEDDKVPVGTVWMAVADAKEVRTKEFRFHYDRIRNKEMAAQMAMLMVWKFIKGKLHA